MRASVTGDHTVGEEGSWAAVGRGGSGVRRLAARVWAYFKLHRGAGARRRVFCAVETVSAQDRTVGSFPGGIGRSRAGVRPEPIWPNWAARTGALVPPTELYGPAHVSHALARLVELRALSEVEDRSPLAWLGTSVARTEGWTG